MSPIGRYTDEELRVWYLDGPGTWLYSDEQREHYREHGEMPRGIKRWPTGAVEGYQSQCKVNGDTESREGFVQYMRDAKESWANWEVV